MLKDIIIKEVENIHIIKLMTMIKIWLYIKFYIFWYDKLYMFFIEFKLKYSLLNFFSEIIYISILEL